MRAIIWKEFRENLVWSLLLLATFGLAMQRILVGVIGYAGLDYLGGERTPLMDSGFLALTTFACPVWALVLGIIQMARESSPGCWAFLTHRPASRTRIFAAKAAAGLALYLASTLIPFLACAAWTAEPGHMNMPFELALLWPGLTGILLGIAFYFAGMLTTPRPDGSRLLGIPAAIVGAIAVHIVPQFWMALLVILCAVAVLLLAAWGSFVAGGDYTPQPAVAKAALAVSLAAGLYVVLLLAAAAGAGIGAVLLPGQFRNAGRSYSDYWIDQDGKLLLSTFFGTVTDFHGVPVKNKNDRLLEHRLWLQYNRPDRYECGYRGPESVFPVSAFTADKEAWYLASNERLFLGFSMEESSPIGSIGPNGFAPPGQPNPPFEQVNPGYFCAQPNGFPLAVRDTVYWVHLQKKTVSKLFVAENGQAIKAVMVNHGPSWNTQPGLRVETTIHIYLIVLVGRTLHLLQADWDQARPSKPFLHGWVNFQDVELSGNATLKTLFVTDLQRDPYSYDDVSLFMTPDESRLIVWYRLQPPLYWLGRQEHVDIVSRDGKIQESFTLPVPRRPDNWDGPAYIFGWNALSPLLGVGACLNSLPGDQRQCACLFRPPFVPYREGDPPSAIPAAIAICILCALLAVYEARQYAFSRPATWLWAVFVLLTGVPGLLAFVGANEWPLRQRCHSCGRNRVVTREDCQYCGAPFPLPARDGTEVLEPA